MTRHLVPVDDGYFEDGTPIPCDPCGPQTPAAVSNRISFPGLPDKFWDARPVLNHIRQAARARVQVPDVVFYASLARLAAMTSHHIGIDSGIGRPAKVNFFSVLVGYSGDGKSEGVKVAQELITPPEGLDFQDELPLGSGEGLSEAYMGMVPAFIEGTAGQRGKWKDVKKQVRHNALFYLDEGEYLVKAMERSGATIGSAIRSAWTGMTIGQTNATEDRTRIVRGGTYSMGMVIGMQPDVAGVLLGDSAGHVGMPQRFIWSTATDPNIPDERVQWPGDLSWNRQVIETPGDRPWLIHFPVEVKQELFDNRIAQKRGQLILSEQDGQSPLMRVKLAALLALLDGRATVNVEDWDLADIIWCTSCEVRDTLIRRSAEQRERTREERDDALVARAVRVKVAEGNIPRDVERVARLLTRHTTTIADGIRRGELREKLHKRDRHLLDQALQHATDFGWVVSADDGYIPGVEPDADR